MRCLPSVSAPALLPLRRAAVFGMLVGAVAACSGGSAVDASPSSEPAAAAPGATSDAGPQTSADGGPAAAADGLRIGPEHTSKVAVEASFRDAGVLRCPQGMLLVGLDVSVPPPNQTPTLANRHRLTCAPVDANGALGTAVTVEATGAPAWPFDGPTYVDWVWKPLMCPAGEVATRLVGATNSRDVVQLGVRCQPLASLVDGGAVTTGDASAPSTLGATSGPSALDVACERGTALAGIVYGTAAEKPLDLVVRSLCRDVLEKTLPGGAPWSASSPVKLGTATMTAILETNGKLPANPGSMKVVRDCPPGQVVTAVDGGRSNSLAGARLLDVQVSCRALGPDGSVGAQVSSVGTTTAARQSTCLLGQAVTGVTFSGAELTLYDQRVFNAEDLLVSCRVPVPSDARSSSPVPSWVPGVPSDAKALQRAAACPAGSVVTGLDLYAPLDGGDYLLTGVALRCRAVER